MPMTVLSTCKRFALGLLMFLAGIGTQPVSAQQPEGVSVPYTESTEGGLPLVQVMLNGSQKASFLLDTGSTYSYLSAELARQMGLVTNKVMYDNGQPATVQGKQIWGVKDVELKIGAIVLPGIMFVEKQNWISLHSSLKIDGIVGMNSLAGKSLFIDPQDHHITLWPATLSDAQRKGLPLNDAYVCQGRIGDKNLLYLTAHLNDSEQVSMALDTGATATGISAETAARLQTPASGKKTKMTSNTVLGKVKTHSLVLDKFVLDTASGPPIESHEASVYYFEKGVTYLSENHLGWDLFKQMYMLIDFSTQKIFFKSVLDRQSDVGLGFQVEMFAPLRMVVVGTDAGYSAQEVGLRKDDEIIQIDGQPLPADAEDLQKLLALKMRQPEGSKVVLTIKRTGEAKPLDLTLTFRKPKK